MAGWHAVAGLATALTTVAAAAIASPAWGAPQGVTLSGRMGDRALLVVDGRTHVLEPGQVIDGVRLLRWEGDAAVVELGGTTARLRLGAAQLRPPPAGIGAPAVALAVPSARAREVVIPVGSGGHFVTDGAINGRAVRFMVDTGATLVSISRDDAERLGIDLRSARTVQAHTAGGPVPVQRVTIGALRVGEVELGPVAAIVTPGAMPYALLGNSALERFHMRRDQDVMRLELR